MKTLNIKRDGTSVKIVNLDATQVVTTITKLFNQHILYAVALASTIADFASKAVCRYAYEVIVSMMEGLNAISATLLEFKKYANLTAAEAVAVTDATAGKKYFASDTKKMYTNTETTTKTLTSPSAQTLHNFTKIATVTEAELESASEGDLFYAEDDELFYEVEIDAETSEKSLSPVSAEAAGLYKDQNDVIYQYTQEVLTATPMVYSATTPTQAEIDARTAGDNFYVGDEGKTYVVSATEVLALVEDASIDDGYMWKDLADNNKLYYWTGADMVAYADEVDVTDYANGHISVETV